VSVRFVVIVLLAVSRVAFADELDEAKALEAKLEYEQALAIVDGALAKGRAEPDRYVELQVFAGRLAAGLDRPDVARQHFAKALAVRPSTALPEGTSPKLTLPFNAEKARATPLAIKLQARRGLLAIEATDVLGLVSQVHVHFAIAGASDSLRVPIAKLISLPAAAYVIDVSALDAAGNTLFKGTPAAMPERKRGHPPFYKWWPTYGAIGAVAFVVGSVSALQFSSTQDRFDRLNTAGMAEFSELRDLERSGKRWALATNIAFGTTIVSAAIAVIVGARYGTGTIGVNVAPNGAMVSGRF
jgi:hypothetical protein